MLESIEGEIISKSATELIINIGGISLKLLKPFSLDSDIPSKGRVKIFTQLCISENDVKIFGFGNKLQRDLFNVLLSVGGVGQLKSLRIVSEVKPQQLVRAIKNKDVAYLRSIKGIGDKLAERISLELKDKIDDLIFEEEVEVTPEHKFEKDAIKALINLGLSKKEAENSVYSALKEIGRKASLEEIIKCALKKI